MLKVVRGIGLDSRVSTTVFSQGSPVFHWEDPVARPDATKSERALVKRLTWEGGIREVFELGFATGRLATEAQQELTPS